MSTSSAPASTSVVASEAWVRPPSCEPGQRWVCPCGDIRPYVITCCLGCYEDEDYHLTSAAALHNYADVVASTRTDAMHAKWGATDPDALAVGEADSIAWDLVADILDTSDKAALDDAIERTVADSALTVLSVDGLRREVEMVLRGLADGHRLAWALCHHDHRSGIGEPCPRSAT